MRTKLEGLDTNEIRKDLAHYYHDLAGCYWFLSNATKDPNWKMQAIKMYQKSIYHDPKNFTAYWQIAFFASDLDNCDLAKVAVKMYRKSCPKKNRNMEAIKKHVDRKCSSATPSET